MTNSQKLLQQIMDNLNKVIKEFSMNIYVKQTKKIYISLEDLINSKIYIDGQQSEQVSHFLYLDSITPDD